MTLNLGVRLSWSPFYERSERLLNRLCNVPKSMIVERAKKDLEAVSEILKTLHEEDADKHFFEWVIEMYAEQDNPFEELLAAYTDFQNESKTPL
ncbi:MAG: hypothetical protein QM730_06535 [Anaerolineales bacterium]